jgi:hypothetical protein
MRATIRLSTLIAAAVALVGCPTAGASERPPRDLRQVRESAPASSARATHGRVPELARKRAPRVKRFVTGIDGTSLYRSTDAGERDRWFDTTADLEAGVVRIDVFWRGAVQGTPANPADPTDPAYDFSIIDGAVTDASERGLDVVLTFLFAPGYAQEGGGEPEGSTLPTGSWKPKPDALGDFAKAVATRYSGAFGGLPRVRNYDVWNEPNLSGFMAPQYEGKKLVAVDRAIDSVHPDNRVVVGSLAPYGDEPGLERTRPLAFLRKLLCLNGKLKKTACPNKTPVDVLSHHPINTSGGPRVSAIDDDDVSTPDMGNVERVLRAAERAGTIAGKRRRHPLWVTEFWWPTSDNSNLPTATNPQTQARYVEESLFLFWKAGVDTAIYYSLTDKVVPIGVFFSDASIGLFFSDGAPKPATKAFRFPFVTERKSEKKVFAWGRAPASGRVVIQRKAGKQWGKVHSENVKAGRVFTAKLSLTGKAKLRATVGGEKSLVWTQRR